ncbi:MAG: 2-oxo acid dehydrogenase subunit E2 [Defluviitaleaceae bacterium]|nr:2-oxo acid dehydrogenase subunit E2 [Defluviitaleaceae bacterium]MCL2238999.1 2-oxo acid dehydrogenase subunit E2 [Defluviitaleaceae bacterium]
MATGVLMPKAGISVESCIIGTWHKQPGDPVQMGDILFDYETDKATFECESTAVGHLIEIFFQSGDEVPCLTVVCAVGQPGEDVSGLKTGSPPVSEPVPASAPAPVSTPSIVEPSIAETSITAPPAVQAGSGIVGAVSPRARKLAERLRVDLQYVTPTGPRGRVIERDIQTAARTLKTGDGIGGRRQDGFIGGAGAASGVSLAAGAGYTDEKMSPIRKVIAKSMLKSLTEIAQLTHVHSCDATVLLSLRRRFKDSGKGLEGISLNDLVIFAVARTLAAHPDLNAHLVNGDTLRRFNGVHLGMAVDTPRGLLVPTIFNADKMSLLQLSAATKDVADMAKSGSISPDLLQGASFTVSNLGALGVEMFTPVINPPQVAILGVCGLSPKVKEENGKIAVYQSMGLALTYDHRAVDGAPASRFAANLAKNLENIDLLMMSL